ncbi:MAG: hypothetical protein AAF899_06155 [Pseudomonadota bacterium]
MRELVNDVRGRAVELARMLAREAIAVLTPLAQQALAYLKRHGNSATDRAIAWLRHSCTIIGKTFSERVVERALKIQIGFLIFLAVVAPFGGMGLEPILSPLLLGQAALTRLALMRVRQRDPIFGAGLYMIIAAVTFIEAKGYSGIVGAIFAFEAMLSLVAAFYIVAILRVREARPAKAEATPAPSGSTATA